MPGIRIARFWLLQSFRSNVSHPVEQPGFRALGEWWMMDGHRATSCSSSSAPDYPAKCLNCERVTSSSPRAPEYLFLLSWFAEHGFELSQKGRFAWLASALGGKGALSGGGLLGMPSALAGVTPLLGHQYLLVHTLRVCEWGTRDIFTLNAVTR